MKWIKYNMEAKRAIYNAETGVKEYIPMMIEAEQQWSEEAEAALKDKIIDIFEDGIAAIDTHDERIEKIENAISLIKSLLEKIPGVKLS